MILLQDNNLIEEKLRGQYEDFLRYCEESGKKFVYELDKEDFIAYRVGYSVAREQVEQIKNLLDFQKQKIVEENSAPQNTFDGQEDSLQKYFKIDNIAPYENVLVTNLNFNTRVQRCLKYNGYSTLAEILKSSKQKIIGLNSFGKVSFDNLLATLKRFFDSRREKKLRENFTAC